MVRRVLVTGMSGTGKSSALERLRRLGFRTVDTDEGDWTEWSEAEGGYLWREERMVELLSDDEGPALYVSLGRSPIRAASTTASMPLSC